ncbi:MAG: hypothetical protein NTW14_07600 [bacterium]|nr:hypothetical protein [bacterium]
MESNPAKIARSGDPRYGAAAQIVAKLHERGYAAYFVGGCVRDLLLGQSPKDYDVATDAKPEEVQALFPGNYAGIEEDSRRRDFTLNALYYDPSQDRIIDLVDGLPDLRQRILRMIGDPFERFDDDWLRMLRAVRFAARFALRIDPLTFEALHSIAPLITGVAPERRTEEIRLMLHSWFVTAERSVAGALAGPPFLE